MREAVNKTLSNSPELQAFDYRLKAQEGQLQQAGRAPSPELSIELEDAVGSGNYTGLDSAQATVSIGWVLERGVRQRYIDAARAGSDLVAVEADIKRLDAAAETARRYLVSLGFQARMVNVDKTVQLARETIEAVARRVKAGKTPEAELLRAQAELARRKLEREDLEHELLSANRQLAAQWGATTLDFARVEGDILTLPQLASLDTLQSQLQQNPVFARLLSEQRLKKAELDLALAQEKPSWRVSAGLRHYQSTDDQALVAGITIPFGEGTRNPGRVAEVRANLAQIDLQQTVTRVRAETALFVLYEKLEHSVHVIETVRSDILPPLEQALTETRRAYNLGRYSYLELRSVQAELLDAQEALIEASIAAHQDIIEIERLTGMRIAQPTQE
ncbi:hypothetical protein Tel_17165 (plasmid) [Candidatus Tenderia electrophaga]|uniref:Transporter n=1 Tax=Candidatus Tenderia electrophaga TaxID=1748243 RepID=A0A0S2TIJ7_9GAMM|nr:hypothetical protein Tel_17165 [Candidatus Tenderia electrophaga]